MVAGELALDPLDWLRDKAPVQRWFADKGRTLTDVRIIWRMANGGPRELSLVIAEYTFTTGEPSLYLVPFLTGSGEEATAHPVLARWLLDSLANRSLLAPGLTWSRLTDEDLILPGSPPAALLNVEQSNTSIRYGEQLLVKLNRRLTVGLSPEVELAAVIAKAADASFAARTHGALLLEGIKDSPICLAICSEFIPNVGDAWAYLLEQMSDPTDPSGAVISEIERIADVTAAMHIGLTSDSWRRSVSPEPITTNDIERWETSSLEAFDEVRRSLEQQRSTLASGASDLLGLLPHADAVVRHALEGFHSLRGTVKIRTHGDYHLGQLLRTSDGAFVVVDFDGEPNRSLAERRSKYSPLRDVAGMLRSIAYARGTAERAAGVVNESAAWHDWERRARQGFLDRYQQRILAQPLPLLPTAKEDVRQALAALELEKAIYECGYELSNRPDWLWLPLSRLVHAG